MKNFSVQVPYKVAVYQMSTTVITFLKNLLRRGCERAQNVGIM